MNPHRIGVCSWSLRPNGPGELVERLAETGLTTVQLALSPMVEVPDTWSGTIAQLRNAGIEIVSGMMTTKGEDYSTLDSIAMTGGVRPDDTWEHNRLHASAVAGLAAEAGIGLVTFHAGFMPEDPDDPERAKLLDRLREVRDRFAEHDVDVAFETGQETAETLHVVLHELNDSGRPVGVNFDPANMILYGKGDPVQALWKLSPHVRQFHVKDATPAERPESWGAEVPVGKGAVDWPAFMKVAVNVEPRANFIIEREAGANRAAEIVAAAELVQRLLDERAAAP